MRERSTYLEYLSSGENLAGCADLVTSPSVIFFRVYWRLPLPSRVYMRCIVTELWRLVCEILVARLRRS